MDSAKECNKISSFKCANHVPDTPTVAPRDIRALDERRELIKGLTKYKKRRSQLTDSETPSSSMFFASGYIVLARALAKTIASSNLFAVAP